MRSLIGSVRALKGPRFGRHGALADEAEFWRRRLTQDSMELRRRRDPRGSVVDPGLIAAIDKLNRDVVTVLDVGSGPLSSVGLVSGTTTVEVTAIDPLADEYAVMLNEEGIAPPCPPIRCSGEDIVKRFGSQCFDVAFAENSLDHAVEPIAVIDAMLEVVRSGGFVILAHYRNEAEASSYGQLHHWNFDEHHGRCLLWRRGRQTVDLGSHIGDRGTVTARTERRPPHTKEWIACTIAKH